MRRLLIALLLCSLKGTSAQTIRVSCPEFLKDVHQRIACVEAIFSQDRYHFTLASVPPSNGFGPGLVLTRKFSSDVGKPARQNELDLSITGAVTTNSSWFAGGDLKWILPLLYKPDSSVADGLRFGKLRVAQRALLHGSAGHMTVRTLYFYGSGSRSPNTQYVFAEDDTNAELDLKMPLARWLVAIAETEIRDTTLPGDSAAAAITAHLPATATPGITDQPLYLNNSLGATTLFTPRVSKPLQRLTQQPDPHLQKLLQFNLRNDITFHWQHPTDGSTYAYRQFIYKGDEMLLLDATLRNFFPADRHPLVRHLCEGNKQTDNCEFGQIDVKPYLVLTQTGRNSQIPFYLQPTLGGTDVTSLVTLRGFENYRFRAPDAAMIQLEYGITAWDPLGVFVFYDAGTVGNTVADLALSHFRQDAGFGLSARLNHHMILQTSYAFGAGHGGRWNYNFAKIF